MAPAIQKKMRNKFESSCTRSFSRKPSIKKRAGKKKDAHDTFVVPLVPVGVPATTSCLVAHVRMVWDGPEGEGKEVEIKPSDMVFD